MAMADLPLVSIVVPTFNHAALVADCLRSVADQSYEALELIVVDDASRDGTPDVIERLVGDTAFARRFPGGVRFERSRVNRGAHQTLNHAVRQARGDFIGIVNSDDRFARDRVKLLVEALRTQRRALAFSAVRMIDTAGRDITHEDWFSNQVSHTQRSIAAFPSVGFAALRHNVAISTGNLFFRRELFERVGGFRPLAYCHDWDFLLRSLLLSEPVFVPVPLYEYRIHDTNSFKSLGSVGNKETSQVLRAYFSAVQRGQFENVLAPAPTTWPGVFDVMLDVHQLWHLWERARSSPAD